MKNFNNLINKNHKKEAVIIFGGPSAYYNFNWSKINRNRFTVFIEPLAVTAELMPKINPDYIIAPYIEKLQANSLQKDYMKAKSLNKQHIINNLASPKFISHMKNVATEFDKKTIDQWRDPKYKKRMPHKRFIIKNDTYFKNSGFDTLKNYPNIPIITEEEAFSKAKNVKYSNPTYMCKFNLRKNIDNQYFNSKVINNKLVINTYSNVVNSFNIAINQILKTLMFEKIYLIGFDMTMLGSAEYNGLNIFKSYNHWAKFFNATKEACSYKYQPNNPIFKRPQHEFANFDIVNKMDKNFVTNVMTDFKYQASPSTLKKITYENFYKL